MENLELKILADSTQVVSLTDKIARLTKLLESQSLTVTERQKTEKLLEKALKDNLTTVELGINTYKRELDVLRQSKDMRNELAASFQSSQAKMMGSYFKTGESLRAMEHSTITARTSLLSMGQVIQDMPYGIRGIGNNVEQLAQQFAYLNMQTGSLSKSLQVLKASFTGTTGLLFLISAAISAWTMWEMHMEKVKKGIKDAKTELDDYIDSLKRMSEEMRRGEKERLLTEIRETQDRLFYAMQSGGSSSDEFKADSDRLKLLRERLSALKESVTQTQDEVLAMGEIEHLEYQIKQHKIDQAKIKASDDPKDLRRLEFSDKIEKLEARLAVLRESSSDKAEKANEAQKKQLEEIQKKEEKRVKDAIEGIEFFYKEDSQMAYDRLYQLSLTIQDEKLLLDVLQKMLDVENDIVKANEKKESERVKKAIEGIESFYKEDSEMAYDRLYRLSLTIQNEELLLDVLQKMLEVENDIVKENEKKEETKKRILEEEQRRAAKEFQKELDTASYFLSPIEDGFHAIGRAIRKDLIDPLIQGNSVLQQFFGGILNGIAQIAQQLASAAVMSGIFSLLGLGGFSELFGSLTGLGGEKMATGGVINEHVVGIGTRTGRTYQFGESGSERVSPLTSFGMGGGNRVVVVSGNFRVSGRDLVSSWKKNVIFDRTLGGNF